MQLVRCTRCTRSIARGSARSNTKNEDKPEGWLIKGNVSLRKLKSALHLWKATYSYHNFTILASPVGTYSRTSDMDKFAVIRVVILDQRGIPALEISLSIFLHRAFEFKILWKFFCWCNIFSVNCWTLTKAVSQKYPWWWGKKKRLQMTH